MSDIQSLRAEVQRARRLALAKQSRLRSGGVEVRGTWADPVRVVGVEKKYTRKQLETYLGNLNSFRDRKTKFTVPTGQNRTPISDASWEKLKSLENRVNLMANAKNRKFDDVFLPHYGMTVGERKNTFVNKNLVSSGAANDQIFHTYDKRRENMTGEKAVLRTIRMYENKLKPSYSRRVVKKHRATVDKMLADIGDPILTAKFAALTARQFNILWNYSGAAEALSTLYELKYASGGGWVDKHSSDVRQEMIDLLDWAAQL